MFLLWFVLVDLLLKVRFTLVCLRVCGGVFMVVWLHCYVCFGEFLLVCLWWCVVLVCMCWCVCVGLFMLGLCSCFFVGVLMFVCCCG